ncbi:cytochrome P450 [Virgibacillus sp. 179-BFC.A HS]|uniref:Cytochrome P450 n=1 Tax=Tigheibacillus jepli TaxID=3035914 RepID=A0ABU5CP58_9BACI|nr:cytochrome P450 [Virgibacillus sp. 179-BFC.A HS]MDY0407243.1 cytochrome P450 [Virgibacillus sp. 179-BFC.A HS]
MPYREQMPIDKGLDHTVAFLREGYKFISNRAKQYHRDIFETRLLGGQKVICLIGKDAAELFYDNDKFKRHGAAPKRVLKTLFGQNGVQTLDDVKHRHRKNLFMSLMTQTRLQKVKDIFKEEWLQALQTWEKQNKIGLYDEARAVLTRTACRWAGVPLAISDQEQKMNELSAMFEGGGAVGPRYMRGKQDRQKAEQWVGKLIGQVREGKMQVDRETALYQIAMFKDQSGQLLPLSVAAVELINILRPIVAISVYIVFCALALYDFPYEKEKLASGGNEAIHLFAEEVRRYYPFFPVTVARVREDFLWKGYDFKAGTLVLLDLYGTNHHPAIWEKPDEFMPERFRTREKTHSISFHKVAEIIIATIAAPANG